MSKKAWIIFAAVCVLVLGSLVALSNSKRVNVGEVDANKVQTASEASGNIADHLLGKTDSKVVLVEYGDFQCPGCKAVHPTIKSLTDKYDDQITFIFRNYPLTAGHPNAFAAAAAAESAGLQGKYWEMHNKLFENQDNWKNISVKDRTDFFVNYAKELNLDEAKFRSDYESTAVATKIKFDKALGDKTGVTGTPGLYLNEKLLDTPIWSDPEKFEAAIVAQLKENNIALPETIKE